MLVSPDVDCPERRPSSLLLFRGRDPNFFYQQFIRQIGAALGISAFVLAATVGGFRLGVALDDCSERRNICVRARVARTQPPRCTPNRRLKNRETRDFRCRLPHADTELKLLSCYLTPIFSHE